MIRRFRGAAALAALALLAALPAAADFTGIHGGFGTGTQDKPSYNDGRPAALMDVGIDQRIDNQVPLDLKFTDEKGETITLAKYFESGKPVVLCLAYYGCPMLCTQVLNGLASSLRGVGLEPGKDFNVVTASFDSTESVALAAAKRANYLERVHRPGIDKAWHFLVGGGESIAKLTDAVGFRYKWDEETKQFAHASCIYVLTPQGHVSRYLFGMEFAPRDLRLALVEASQNKVGNVVDQVLLFCYHYDPSTGKYGAVAMNILRVAGVLTLIGIAALILLLLRRERKLTPPPSLPTAMGTR